MKEPALVRLFRVTLWAGLLLTGSWLIDGQEPGDHAGMVFACYNAFVCLLLALHFARHH